MDDSHERAVARFRESQVHAHLASLGTSTMRGKLDTSLEARNLVGTPDGVGAKIQAYVDAGVRTFAGLLFATDTVAETLDAMEHFATSVIHPMTGSSTS